MDASRRAEADIHGVATAFDLRNISNRWKYNLVAYRERSLVGANDTQLDRCQINAIRCSREYTQLWRRLERCLAELSTLQARSTTQIGDIYPPCILGNLSICAISIVYSRASSKS